jgi:hypothetical protein
VSVSPPNTGSTRSFARRRLTPRRLRQEGEHELLTPGARLPGAVSIAAGAMAFLMSNSSADVRKFT